MDKKQSLLAWGLLLALAAIWGSSFILIKKALVVYSAGEVGALRIVSAFLFLLPLAIISLKKVKRQHWIVLLCVGFVGSFIPSFLFATAQTKIPSSVAGILNALTPLFTLVLGALLFAQQVVARKFAGVILGFAGCGILIFAGSTGAIDFNAYGLLVVLATLFYSINLNLIKFKLAELGARTITSISLFMVGPAATIYLVFFTGFTGKVGAVEGSYWALAAVSLLGILGTAIALLLFNQLVKITSPLFTSSVTYIIPMVAVVWGLIDGERLYPGHYLGMAFIISGVYLANKARV